eukprot:104353_1
MSFKVPNMSNTSFPIIKIQQQPLPHLPPFVSAQNGQTCYPLQQNGNIINNINNINNDVKYIPLIPPIPTNYSNPINNIYPTYTIPISLPINMSVNTNPNVQKYAYVIKIPALPAYSNQYPQ